MNIKIVVEPLFCLSLYIQQMDASNTQIHHEETKYKMEICCSRAVTSRNYMNWAVINKSILEYFCLLTAGHRKADYLIDLR